MFSFGIAAVIRPATDADQPRSLELLKLLGVLPEILKHTIPLRPLRQYGPDGKEIVETWLFDTMEPVRPDVPFVSSVDPEIT